MKIFLHFDEGKVLEVADYTTINIQRSKRILDINFTNSRPDLTLHDLYDKIIEMQGEDVSFTLSLQADSGDTAEYDGLIADYYHNGICEILHVSTKDKG